MSWRYLIWNVVNFPMSFLVTGQISAPYNRTNITRVRNGRILVALKRFWLWKTFLLNIWYIYCPSFLNPSNHFLLYFPRLLYRSSYIWETSHLPIHGPAIRCLICFQVGSSYECSGFSTLMVIPQQLPATSSMYSMPVRTYIYAYVCVCTCILSCTLLLSCDPLVLILSRFQHDWPHSWRVAKKQ